MNVLKKVLDTSLRVNIEKIHNIRKLHASNPMCSRFVQYLSDENTPSLGILSSDSKEIIDLSNVNSTIPNTLVEYLQNEPEYSKIIPKLVFVYG